MPASYTAAHPPNGSCQVGGDPQLLTPRGLLPRKPPVPVGYALAQFGPLGTELSTGDRRVRKAITVSLRIWLSEHDYLLIGAVRSDSAIAGVVPMISLHTDIGLLFSRDLLIRRDLQSRRLPAQSPLSCGCGPPPASRAIHSVSPMIT